MPTIETDSAKIHYSRTGAGPAVLLLQGVGVAGRGWMPQVEALVSRHTVITIDNRGIGGSSFTGPELTIEDMAADALAVMDSERIDAFHLAGHSMGGLIAQQIALAEPHRILSLALLCTFFTGRQGTTVPPAMLLTAIRSRVGSLRMRRRAFVRLVMPRDYLEGRNVEDVAAELGRVFGRDLGDAPPIVMRQLRAMRRFDASPRLAGLASIPTVVVSGACDCIASPRYGRALASAIPGSRLVEFADAGHALTIQKADEVNALLLEHFSLTPEPSATARRRT